ncbi:unnamed protein product [Lupinus luteus]|uniref:Terpene synthase metal-binding domain-containing protein n=1 Tax=Lupinus luteus TaxID=3873 RepID=A0AAV1XNB4_LUPLU
MNLLSVLEDESNHGENVGMSQYYIIEYCLICDITQAYLLEAKWCKEGYIPTYDEYKINGIITSTFTVQITSFIALGDFATKDVFDWISSNPNNIKAASIIGRVMDDMASHNFEQKRVHVASAVECCIKQHGISEEEAYELINKDVKQCWKIINEEYLMKPNYIPNYVLDCVANLARMCELVYQNREDKYTDEKLMKDYVFSMLVDPVCINLHHQHEKLSLI